MRFYLDTADHREVRELYDWGCFAGVTTNPIILARAGTTVEKAIRELSQVMPGEIFAQAVGKTAAAIADDGARLAALAPGRMIIKVPITPAGIEAIRLLAQRNVLTAATAVFRATQAVMAARAGAAHVIPFWHRIGESGGDPAREVTDSAHLLERLASAGIRPRVLCASLRTPEQAISALRAGAHAITVGPDVARAMLDDAGTRAAVAQFDNAPKAPEE